MKKIIQDEAVEDAIYDRLSFQEFLGIDTLSSNVPDATIVKSSSSTKSKS